MGLRFSCCLKVNYSVFTTSYVVLTRYFHIISYRFFFMEEASSSVSLWKFLDRKEEVIVDRDGNVFDPIFSVCRISQSKEQLWSFKSQGRDVLNAWNSFMYYFSIEQTLYYPEFVEWCVNNYSPTERVIMNKKLLGSFVSLMQMSSTRF